jgi:serine/threonine protein phosphatase 1
MFSRLFPSRYLKADPAEARGPAGSDIYAIGDIHGRIDLLRKLQSAIVRDAAERRATRKLVVYLGDYIDRGADSRSVIAHLIEQPLPGFESVFLKGNHEDSLLEFLDDSHAGVGWLSFGGDATLYSYGVRPPNLSDADEVVSAQKALAQSFPADHLAFFKSMKLMHIEGDYAFVHAGVRQNIPLDRQAPEDLMWIRGEFLESQADFGKRIVHGHSIEARPVVRRNRIGIDTGAFATGMLTCLVISGEETRFLAT